MGFNSLERNKSKLTKTKEVVAAAGLLITSLLGSTYLIDQAGELWKDGSFKETGLAHLIGIVASIGLINHRLRVWERQRFNWRTAPIHQVSSVVLDSQDIVLPQFMRSLPRLHPGYFRENSRN